MSTPQSLLALAMRNFKSLTDSERRLLVAVEAGEQADCGGPVVQDGLGYWIPAPADDPESKNPRWLREHTVRATLIRWLCTDHDAQSLVTPSGIALSKARIVNPVDLTNVSVGYPLVLECCLIEAPMSLVGASLRELVLSGSRCGPIYADRFATAGSVSLRDSFVAIGTVRLIGAYIGGDLTCSGALLFASDVVSLLADAIDVKGNVYLNRGFTAYGGVQFTGATIGQDLDLSAGVFSSLGGPAISANGIRVGGNIFISELSRDYGSHEIRCSLNAVGEVALIGATVSGSLECTGGQFTNPGGSAIDGDRLDVGGTVSLGKGFTANGEVRLLGAVIGRNVECLGGAFCNPVGNALSLDGIDVSGAVLWGDGFAVTGRIRLNGARISAQLGIVGTTFRMPKEHIKQDDGDRPDVILNLEHIEVGQFLIWRDVDADSTVTISLAAARVGTFATEWRSWPVHDNSVLLDGFLYDRIRIASESRTELQSWTDDAISWIHRQWRFAAQPYEQLAHVLGTHGYQDEARRVAIAKQDHIRRNGQLAWLPRQWLNFYHHFMRYGYEWWLPLVWATRVVLIGTLFFWFGHEAGEMFRTDDYDRGRLWPFFYSLDVFVPIIDLDQREQWRPSGRGIFGVILLGWYWLEIALGWLMSSIFVAGLAGLVRND